MSFETRLQERLAERKHDQLFRQRLSIASSSAAEVRLSGQTASLLNFCSNDYLGLARHPALQQSLCEASKHYGVGSTASPLVVGHFEAHKRLEEELADFLGVERCLLFGSGYSANIGVLTTLLGKKDIVLEDKLNHASLLDGALYTQAKFSRYAHLDMEALQKKLQASGEHNTLVVSDAVFSMDGDCADIKALNTLSKKHGACLMLDDAHGFGVCGEQGRGSVSAQGELPTNVDVYMATFGKALGTSGAFVAGSDTLIESLIQFCRHYIYSTAMSPAMAETTRHALRLVQEENWRREHLQGLVQFFRHEANIIGLDLLDSHSAIQPVLLGGAEKAMAWSEALLQDGLLVRAIRPPTVPPNASRLRITLSAAHDKAHVEKLLEALMRLQKQDVLEAKGD